MRIKYLLYIILLALPFMGSGQKHLNYKAKKFVKVDNTIKPYWNMVVKFYKDNDVDINYRHISRVYGHESITGPRGEGLAGSYKIIDRTMRIRTKHPMAYYYGLKDEIMVCIIAHELAHSQGILEHDGSVLMKLTKVELLDVLIAKKIPLSEILLEPYIKFK